MAFDGIITKAIVCELQEIIGARVDKIYQPSKNDVVIGLYINGKNYALNICTDSRNYRIHLTTHSKPNPQNALNFCMLLRKNLIGLRIKNIICANLERVVTIEFEGFDDIDDIINKKLIIELMGKHCNIILLGENNVIIDSLRHISSDNELTRDILPHIKYTYPITTKTNFLELDNFDQFKNKILLSNISTDILNKEFLSKTISDTFNGISTSFVQNVFSVLNLNNTTNFNDSDLEKIYLYIKDIVLSNNTTTLDCTFIENTSRKSNDFALLKNDNILPFHINFFIDDYYFNKENNENFKLYRDNISKLILVTLKKYKKRLANINNKLKECENLDIYKLYGELITANLYRIPNHNVDKISLENYYDNNTLITISLDQRYSPAYNAKLFFKKYNKLKNALKIVTAQKEETLKELNYIESVVYELELCTSIDDVVNIFEEISDNSIFKEKTSDLKQKNNQKIKKSKLTTNKKANFNPIKYNIEDYTLLIGRNNFENDYLTLKYARKNDLWFHVKDIPGSHCVLLLENKSIPSDNILVKCAELAASHSKAENSSNVPVDFCEIKYVKKPNGAKPGMVIYTNNKTLYVTPKKL